MKRNKVFKDLKTASERDRFTLKTEKKDRVI